MSSFLGVKITDYEVLTLLTRCVLISLATGQFDFSHFDIQLPVWHSINKDNPLVNATVNISFQQKTPHLAIHMLLIPH